MLKAIVIELRGLVESIQHFLCYCPKWRNERTKLMETMADRWGDLAYALGGWSGRRDGRTGRFVDGPREKWKPNLRVIKAMTEFVMNTGRFQLKATVAEYTSVAERADEEAEYGEEASVAQEIGESDDNVGRSL
jgi:hypothetical protein